MALKLSPHHTFVTVDLRAPEWHLHFMATGMPRSKVSSYHTLRIKTSRRTELKHVTEGIAKIVRESGCVAGVCHLYVPHTTAGVMINEGYDPDVASDMEAALDKLVPRNAGYRHAEGNSDSHIKTALIGSSETIWIEEGELVLGRWQVIFFAEFDGPRTRELRVKIVPDSH